MMDEKTRRTAERFDIIDKVEKLQKELLQIDGVIDVEFDIDGFYDNIGDFIFLTKYDIPVTLENYFEVRKRLKQNVIEVAKNNGLRRSGGWNRGSRNMVLLCIFARWNMEKITRWKHNFKRMNGGF